MQITQNQPANPPKIQVDALPDSDILEFLEGSDFHPTKKIGEPESSLRDRSAYEDIWFDEEDLFWED
ncbi:MAG: hypothetical protein ACKO23_10480 [Gemmataceae bacterium]